MKREHVIQALLNRLPLLDGSECRVEFGKDVIPEAKGLDGLLSELSQSYMADDVMAVAMKIRHALLEATDKVTDDYLQSWEE